LRLSIGVGFLVALLAYASAQDKPAPDKPAPDKPEQPEKPEKGETKKGVPREEDYREFFKTPETTQEFWDALQFELGVGRPDLAARLLRELIKRNPTDEELVQLNEKVGPAAFLRLRTVPRWSADPKVNEQAIKDTDELSDRVGKAMQKVLG